MKSIFPILAVGLLLSQGVSAQSGETPASPTLSILKSVTLAELPGQAAALVAAADTKSQAKTAVDVVKAAVGLNPAAAPAIVASICASTPSVAAIVAATAAGLLPQQAAYLAQVAAAAAPKMAGKIVEAVCKIAPDDYKAVADAVASVVPDASREILEGVVAALPGLKDAIDSALTNYKSATPSVSVVLAQVASSSNIATLASGLPTGDSPIAHGGPKPPYQPRTSDPGSVNIGGAGSGQVPPGGQNYSTPPGNQGG